MALRRFGMSNLDEIDRMTYRAFRLRMKAYELRRLDEEYRIALLAWQIREIEAKKKNGKNKYRYTYDSFRKFFDYDVQERRIMGYVNSSESEKTLTERYKDYMRAKQWQDMT